jgi:hypothetical protein
VGARGVELLAGATGLTHEPYRSGTSAKRNAERDLPGDARELKT